MKPESAASFVAAVLFHALLLFGFKMDTPARPLAMSEEEESEPVDVSLVEAAPETAPPDATPAPQEPAPTPEPPQPPAQQPTPEMSTPPPEPAPTPEQETIPAPESTPVPQAPKPAPRRQEQRRPKLSAPHAAAALAGTAGAASHGAASGPLSSHARYLSNPRPDYPPEARRERQEGVVLVNVEVGADGRAAGVSLKRSSGFPLLDEAALQAVRRWTFEPARAAGFAVSSRVDVPVRFTLAR